MNLVVTSLTLVDLTNQEAKKVSFMPTKNFITSAHNHLGKSVIMKSIYYTLGADVFFPETIKKLNLLTYIDFELDGKHYRVARLKRQFCVYCDGIFVSKYRTVGAFETFLSKIFKLEINLVGKGPDEAIITCPPTFYFLPYYIDQENGWSAASYSFRDVAMVDAKQRRDSYYFHLGSIDKKYVSFAKQEKFNIGKIQTLKEENQKLCTVINTLQMGINDVQMSFDIESLEQAIDRRKEEINRLLWQLEQDRNELLKLEDDSVRTTHDKNILAKYIRRKDKVHVSVEDHTVECPRCGNLFDHIMSEQLEKTYLMATLLDDYAIIIETELSLSKKIEKIKKRFEDNQRLLKDYEQTLSTEEGVYEVYLKSKATGQLLLEYNKRIGNNTVEISKLEESNKEIRKQVKSFDERKMNANSKYQVHFNSLLSQFDIPQDQVAEGSGVGASIVASGAYGPRAKISQVLAFIQAKQQESPNTISFPVVIDSPNTLEQDAEHFENVMRTLLTWSYTDNQIIIASIQGAEIAASIDGVNIITLTNKANHMFNSDEYAQNENEILSIVTQF